MFIAEIFFSRVFKINELKTEVANHLTMLEKKVERECLFILFLNKELLCVKSTSIWFYRQSYQPCVLVRFSKSSN